MSRFYKYAIAQLKNNPSRDERLNLAVVVLNGNELDVRVPKSLDKIRALSAAINIDKVRESLSRLPELDLFIQEQGVSTEEERLSRLAQVTPIAFSSIGQFNAASAEAYSSCVQQLLLKLVEPEPAPIKAMRRSATKLLADVKTAFKSEGVLALKGEGLDAHRIVMNHKVAEGLSADLLLKNGSMHVVQTVDASSEEASMRMIKSIAVSALVFEQARMRFGEDQTNARLVYKASSTSEALIAPSLHAAEHQGATLINWESRDDRTRFIVELSSLAEPIDSRKLSPTFVHASAVPKLKLN